MYPVDRSIAIVQPKQPFLDWIESLPGSEIDITLEQLRTDSTAYLIPDFEDLEDALSSLDKIHNKIFEAELAEWSDDEDSWPKHRTLKVFWEWFDVKLHSIVVDAVEDVAGELSIN